MKTIRFMRRALDIMILLLALPLLGVMVAGKPIADFIEFPPLTRHVQHAPFSWVLFLALAVVVLVTVCPFVARVARSGALSVATVSRGRFPGWGWCGVGLVALSWGVAWSRIPCLAGVQTFIFTPLWLGYVVVVNALTHQRVGRCMLVSHPFRMVVLFLVSAVFWWYFEYLNRFVQNWYYVGIDDLSGLEYFLYATLPFSTVLPAVLGTHELLKSMPRLSAGLDRFATLRISHPRLVGAIVFVVSCAGLAMVGVWPDFLFPLLWLSPLLIITSLQAAAGRKTVFSGLAMGDWRRVVLPALSALICGFFWEMWNWHSLAKWIYEVPFVGRFKVFEMPILGFAGYLPFGVLCIVIAEAVMNRADADEPVATAIPTGDRPREATWIRYVNGAILAGLALYFFVAPGVLVVKCLVGNEIGGEGIPPIAWTLHRALTPKYQRWAEARVASGKAGHLNLYDVPSTEWPMFGSVYYLWATEALQRAWEEDHSVSREEPRIYAREAIMASVALIMDPVHHSWVKTHWGEDYLHRKNVFFRSLIIAGLTSHEILIGDGTYRAALRDQVDTLSAALDASPHGVLDDYPDECYPIDVFSAIACIQRADWVLGTDHRAFLRRSIRAFSGEMLDSRGLVPFLASERTGALLGPSRGTGNSYVLIFAPELWPDVAKDWYARYEQNFWQEKWWAAGFREYPREIEPEYARYIAGREFYDVDAGPIIAGFSPAANAFGLAAAKVNGRLDHAATIGAQVLVSSWPLPNGSLLGPRLLSSQAHAPYLGEACLLFFLTQRPHPSATMVTGGSTPGCVFIGLLIYFGTGFMLLLIVFLLIRRWRARMDRIIAPYQRIQLCLWLAILAAALTLFLSAHLWMAVFAGLLAWIFPLTQARARVLDVDQADGGAVG